MTEDKKTVIIKGVAASPGLAFGVARVIYRWEQSVEERTIDKAHLDEEINRLDTAVKKTLQELSKHQKTAGAKIGGPVARIFDSQLLIASDQDFLDKVKSDISKTMKSAEYIYSMHVENTLQPLRRSRDKYMRQMVNDIEAVSHRVIRYLTGQIDTDISQYSKDCIFVGKMFTPAEVLGLFERDARAIITSEGSPNSHMALIARSLIIPTVMGVRQIHMKIRSGDRLIVDGEKGEVIINPPKNEYESLRKRGAELRELPLSRLKKLHDFPPKMKDNKEILVSANINLPGPLDIILSKRNIGVGLYRTEFMYLQRGDFPSEDEQFEVYDSVAELYHPQGLVIRTFDLGSDKFIKDENSDRENNPALGWRGIRASLGAPKIFREQVRAILRASTRGNVKLLLPMIADLPELDRALGLIKRSMVELRKSKIAFDTKIKIGIMVEVPSAAIAADILATKVAFFSIGSNDLTQYALAVDRDNPKIARLFNSLHPAVLRLIRTTVEAAKNNGIPVTVCGEMSGDPLATPLLIGMGVDELSMNPSRLGHVSSVITKLNYEEAKSLADEISRMSRLKDIEKRLIDFNMSL